MTSLASGPSDLGFYFDLQQMTLHLTWTCKNDFITSLPLLPEQRIALCPQDALSDI